jgi:Asp/Glu/hydantoin racemase
VAVRVALIHALAHSVAPANAALARAWPECERINLLDDSLAIDLARAPGGLDTAMTARVVALADHAVASGAHGILYTCSAFGPCIAEAARRHRDRPVLAPTAAMIEEAVAHGGRIGLLATYAPTLASLVHEFPAGAEVRTALAAGAMAALDAGDGDRHDALAAEAATALVADGCALIALAQFSLARAATAVAARCGVPVLTTVDAAVRALRRCLEGLE